MANANPISGPYSAPQVPYHADYGEYTSVVIVSATSNNPFTATGSFSNPRGVSTNDNAATAVITFKNGSSITAADMASGVIYPFDILSVSGTFTTGKRITVYY